MVSIREVAYRCGVSVATVSKALNGKSDIGEETRKRIREIADDMGYLPNATARTLRSKKSYIIGVLFGDREDAVFMDEFFPRVLNSLKKAVEKRGYEIIFINKEIGNHSMTYLEHCRYRSLDGVVLAYVRLDDPEIMELVKSDFPIVSLDCMFDGRTSVCYDNSQGMRDLTTYIYNKGHRKIAYIHGEGVRTYGTTRSRINSFIDTMAQFGIIVPEEYIKEGVYLDFRKAGRLTAELLDLPDPPTCIMYPNDFSALGGIGEIYRRKLTVPDDISIAGYDGIPLAKALTPELTTLEQNLAGMGDAVADSIVRLIEHPESADSERIMIQGRVSQGNSVKDLTK